MIRELPGNSSKDNQIGLLLVVSDDGILHVTVKSETYRDEQLHGGRQTAVSTSQKSSTRVYDRVRPPHNLLIT